MTTMRERLLEYQAAPSPEAIRNIHDDANFWRTCAVGEQREMHPGVVLYSDEIEGPVDATLYQLGMEFEQHLRWRDAVSGYTRKPDIEAALTVLEQIEDRVLSLKRATP